MYYVCLLKSGILIFGEDLKNEKSQCCVQVDSSEGKVVMREVGRFNMIKIYHMKVFMHLIKYC